ncbi:hypothetical protein H2C43_08110 [Corynebacterium glutamicum]|uniref:Uncharacterized protein n=1 Tax=Corynebacterium glutamicum (strain ATCC 13032 / DSM 20300 / JCM 1318 / BCRC 11384 / CCUG 27702 / LMG 3730 / NBRC 12168 / NCIMB 10025 / NRRL B-2784 / 534) TaxID=196627 RepID=Q8NPP9_CORGL|nr:hypothetical protein [Corynebacterium glutamicum]ARV64127.1 hypothetical protein B7P23_04060 [Corynebacterium glutamicum]AUI01248.1 hypothetical protein CYL77_08920 [Corynebacterium glutamicum]AUI04898.1 hypothetical protein C0I99_12615 [Corynebacterium glutamicum]MBA4570609.1 hypothetical protein [Corynebacterium glutamicum]MBA4573466.1 hypothetical protein [Corynebacterium glutamicum]
MYDFQTIPQPPRDGYDNPSLDPRNPGYREQEYEDYLNAVLMTGNSTRYPAAA